MSDREDATARAAAYAAGAMSADERAMFEAELAADPELAAEARGFVETAARLGMAVEPVEPPEAMRASVLDAITRLPQHGSASAASGEPEPAIAPVVPLRPWYRRPLALVAAAAVVVGLAGGATAYVLTGVGTTQAPTASEQILAASDARTATAPVAGGGTATVVWSVSLASAAIVTDELPPLADDRVYELWYIDDDGPRAAGTFTTHDGAADVELAGSMTPGASVGITVEPAGGSEQPTTDPILVVATA